MIKFSDRSSIERRLKELFLFLLNNQNRYFKFLSILQANVMISTKYHFTKNLLADLNRDTNKFSFQNHHLYLYC